MRIFPQNVKRLGILTLTVIGCCCLAADWPQWRGPFFNGSTGEKNLPHTWDATNGISWKSALPGFAGSTPIVSGRSVFLTSSDDEKRLLLLKFDASAGREVWRRVVATGDRDKGRNTMASPSPCTDGETVYVMFATGDIAAFDFDGNRKWFRNLAREYGSFAQMWIYGSSPLLHNGRLYVSVLQRSPVPSDYPGASRDGDAKRESFLLCLDPATGTNLWRHIRTTGAEDESMEAYTTPIPRTIEGGTEILVLGANHLTAHDSVTGRELWRTPDLNRKKVTWWRVVPSAVVVGDTIVICGPRRDPVFAIRPATQGQLDEKSIAWEFADYPSDCPSPAVYNGMLFVLDGDRQVMTRLDPRTGEVVWQGNLGVREAFRASPLAADGKLYCVSEAGTVVVLSAGNEFKILSTLPAVQGEAPVRASMVAAQGRLFLRTAKSLVCIGGK